MRTFFARRSTCTKHYILKTPKAKKSSITSIPCFGDECPNLLPTQLVKKFIGPLNSLDFEEADHERSRRVALKGNGALKIVCDACKETVGVVLQEDVKAGIFGENKVKCPKCHKAHCVLCGNEEHDGKYCPPDVEVQEVLGKHAKDTKRCPNCGGE